MTLLTRLKGSRRPKLMMLTAGAAALVVVLATPPLAAQATVLTLPTSTVYLSKTYYSTPRVKPTVGPAIMTVANVTETCGGGGYVKVGMRTNPGASGESTQYPSFTAWQHSVTIQFRNVGAPPAVQYTFAATTYYFDANIGCSATAGTWRGSIDW